MISPKISWVSHKRLSSEAGISLFIETFHAIWWWFWQFRSGVSHHTPPPPGALASVAILIFQQYFTTIICIQSFAIWGWFLSNIECLIWLRLIPSPRGMGTRVVSHDLFLEKPSRTNSTSTKKWAQDSPKCVFTKSKMATIPCDLHSPWHTCIWRTTRPLNPISLNILQASIAKLQAMLSWASPCWVTWGVQLNMLKICQNNFLLILKKSKKKKKKKKKKQYPRGEG